MPLLRHRTRGVRAVVLSICALLWATPVAADPPDDPIVFLFTGEDRIYALDGDEVCQDVLLDGADVQRCLAFDLLVDARGRYEGTVTLTFEGNGIDGVLLGSLKGKQKRRRGTTQLDLRATRLRGGFEFPLGVTVPARARLRCDGTISAVGALDAVCDYVLTRPGRGADRGEIPLPVDVVGGEWDVEIETLFVLPNDRIEGSASDSFGFSTFARGRYNERRDRSKLTLKGQRRSLSQGAKVLLKNMETPAVVEATADARYKLLGARGRTQVFSEVDE